MVCGLRAIRSFPVWGIIFQQLNGPKGWERDVESLRPPDEKFAVSVQSVL